MVESIEVWPDKVCYTWGSKCYHRAAYQMFNQSYWWTKGKGFVRSVCGVIDSHQFAHFWYFHQTDEEFLRSVRDSRLVACKRCFPDGPPIFKERYCSLCHAKTAGAPLCDRCARKLRRDCQLIHLAIAARAYVGSGAVGNLRRDEARVAEYDEWKEANSA